MDIDLVFKIAAVGIIVAVLNQLLVRSDRLCGVIDHQPGRSRQCW